MNDWMVEIFKWIGIWVVISLFVGGFIAIINLASSLTSIYFARFLILIPTKIWPNKEEKQKEIEKKAWKKITASSTFLIVVLLFLIILFMLNYWFYHHTTTDILWQILEIARRKA
jgi:H+/Cl- antiporter ClcA